MNYWKCSNGAIPLSAVVIAANILSKLISVNVFIAAEKMKMGVHASKKAASTPIQSKWKTIHI